MKYVRGAHTFMDLPQFAAWRHGDGRRGFEVVFLSASPHRGAEGDSAAVEAGDAWTVHYAIDLDDGSVTKRARATGRSSSGHHEVELEADGKGHWRVDGRPAAHLYGCLDVDLEASCLTNAFPVHRLCLEVGQAADAPAAYVRPS